MGLIGRRDTFFFAGGGTGGHLYPGLAIAERLRARAAPAAPLRCVFLCSRRPVDARVLTGQGQEFVPLAAQPLALSPRALWRFAHGWAPSVRAVRALIRAAKGNGESPVMVAMGGFVAAPAVQAARVEKVPITLVNLDAVPGKANRWIARRATTCITAAPVEHGFASGWQRVPPIVRASALPDCTPRRAREQLALDPERAVLMVTGGSQGADSVNDFLSAFVASSAPALRNWQVVHQTGERDLVRTGHLYRKLGIDAIVVPFIENMPLVLRASHLAISRAGGTTLAELAASGVPAILLPYPKATDDHQRKNADLFSRAGACKTLDQRELVGRLDDHLAQAVVALTTGHPQRVRMAHAMTQLAKPEATRRVARAIARLLETAQFAAV